METLAPAPACRHSRIRVETSRPAEFIDITDRIQASVAGTGIRDGLVNVQSMHTTTAILVNEHEPLAAAGLRGAARANGAGARGPTSTMTWPRASVNLAPGERPNGHAHCRALLMPSSASLNLAGGQLQLGRWQRVFLVEMDGPRSREISVLVLGTAAP